MTIRILGGLLSSFYLSGGDRVLLDKAADLGTRCASDVWLVLVHAVRWVVAGAQERVRVPRMWPGNVL